MEELKRLRQQHVEQQNKLLQAEIEADIALVLKAKESISKEKCKAAAKEFFIQHGLFPIVIGQCSAYVNVSASKVNTVQKTKSVVACLKGENVQHVDGKESNFYFVQLQIKDLFKD